MDAGEVFSIGFRTCNITQQTGGEWIEYPIAVKQQHHFGESTKMVAAEKPAYKKDPKHYENSTRNIRILPDGEIRKVHLRLIRRFNSKTVL